MEGKIYANSCIKCQVKRTDHGSGTCRACRTTKCKCGVTFSPRLGDALVHLCGACTAKRMGRNRTEKFAVIYGE